jgi:leucyl-tRNA synthetase
MIVNEDGTLNSNVRDCEMNAEQEYMLNYTIKKIADDIENLNFNTAVSQMMIFLNEFSKAEIKPKIAMEKFVICLSTFAPHISEEL